MPLHGERDAPTFMQPLTVVQIDFLPASYRQQTVRRRDRRWRVAVLAIGAVLLAAAWIYRVIDHRAAHRNFEILTDAHQAALQTQQAWQAAQTKLDQANREAALITYLKHPATTSQTLAAIIAPLPESLRLTEIKIVRETLRQDGEEAAPRRNLGDKPDAADAGLPPAERDLAQLRREYDKQQVVVMLSGEALDGEALYQYIRQLASGDVFVRAELTSLVRDASAARSHVALSRFQARAVMRPGIGQPGGPDVPPAEPRLATETKVPTSTGALAAETRGNRR